MGEPQTGRTQFNSCSVHKWADKIYNETFETFASLFGGLSAVVYAYMQQQYRNDADVI